MTSSTATVIHLSSVLTKAVVYQNRALLSRRCSTTLSVPGEYCLLVDGPWKQSSSRHLQLTIVTGGDGIVLHHVQVTPLKRNATAAEIMEAQQTLDTKYDDLTRQRDAAEDAVELHKYTISCYKSVLAKVSGSSNSGSSYSTFHVPSVTSPEAWKEVATMGVEGVKKHTALLREAEDSLESLTAQLATVEEQRRSLLSDQCSSAEGTTREVAEVLITCTKPTEVQLMLSHLVRNVTWVPQYEIRVDTKARSMTMGINAQVRQSTGESWTDVELELSTATPHVLPEPPVSTPWRVGVATTPAAQQGQQLGTITAQRPAGAVMMSTVLGGGGCSFSIPGIHTIEGTNTPTHVAISHYSFTDIVFRYTAVPKLSEDTYIKVKAVNNCGHALLPGYVSVFADNMLVGSHRMNLVAPGESFWTPVGVDESLVVQRVFVSQKTSDTSGIFAARKTVSLSYVFVARSSKQTKEELVVLDQFPVSEEDHITVALLEPRKKKGETPAIPFEVGEGNTVEWMVTLEPGKEVTWKYSFTVECGASEVLDGPLFH